MRRGTGALLVERKMEGPLELLAGADLGLKLVVFEVNKINFALEFTEKPHHLQFAHGAHNLILGTILGIGDEGKGGLLEEIANQPVG